MTTYHMDFDDRDGRSAGVQGLVNLSGALVSLALIGGAAYWGYQLTMRDVAGVPVVQAMEGDFRVAPDDPGGMNTPHQGLAVNEIAAEGTAGGPADAVQLAPPKSSLAEDDAPQTVLAAEAQKDAERAAEAEQAAARAIVDDPDLAALTDPTANVEPRVPDAAPEGALATDLAVMEALMGASGPAEEASTVTDDAAATASPRPEPRPGDDRRVASIDGGGAVAAPNDGAGALEIPTSSLMPGTKMAQLGAFATPDLAREHWREIAARFEDRFADKRRVVQEAEAGGNTFYRLRAEGFADLAEARRFCSALLSGRADCIPVELR